MTITSNNPNTIEAGHRVREAFQRFKKESNMDDLRWYYYCKRYENGDISTIMKAISKKYGKLPRCAVTVIRKEISKEIAIYQMCNND